MSKKILLVEDDTMLCTIFGMFIQDLGHELIGVFRTGEEALNFCNQHTPDLIVLDIHLEGEINGIEVAKTIDQQNKIPIVFLSSDFEKSTINSLIFNNVYGFLTKPVYKDMLGVMIEFAVAKYYFEKK